MHPSDTAGAACAPDMNEVVGRTTCCSSPSTRCATTWPRELAAAGPDAEPGRASAGRRAGRSGTRPAASPTPRTRRSSPASCRPRPAPGPHPRLFAVRFPGSETTARRHLRLRRPDLVAGAGRGAATTRSASAASGSSTSRAPLGGVLPGLFAGEPLGAGARRHRPRPRSRRRSTRAERVVAELPAERRLFLFLNVSALHQPNRFYLPGATREAGDSRATHAAALEYVDRHIGRLFAALSGAAAAASPSSAPTTAPPTARTATPATGSATRSSGPCPTPSSSWSRPMTVTATDGPMLADAAAVPGLRVRLPAQDGVPAAAARAPRCATCGPASRGDALFLYLHVPFCEMRCGFCNLFTRIGAPDELTGALPRRRCERQADAVREALGDADRRGSPARDRRRHADLPGRRRAGAAVRHRRAARWARTCGPSRCRWRRRRPRRRPTGWPCSPSGAPPGSASACRASSTPRRARAGRPQRRAEVEAALAADPRRRHPRPQHRPDLRHRRADRGQPGARRCDAALAWRPEELYLYPLYVRPLTGLGRRVDPATATGLGRPAAARCYRAGPRPSARARATSRCRCGCSAAPDAPPQRPGRLLLPGRRHGRPRLRRPLVHPRPALLLRLRGRRAARCARIIDDYLRRPADFAPRRGTGSPGRRGRAAAPLAAAVAAAGRGRGPWRTTGRRFGADPYARLPASWTRWPTRGWLDDDAAPAAAADRRGAGALRRDRARGSSRPRVRAAMAEYEPK